ncbi:MAG: hypothetical protein HOQ22_10065 [Nocardioidaceae bacterium]|nr:hypothetical protein [Nocardioidaceae bacterium]NUS51369.1 hypothetical protein [Nocardioidaceae bacterium]
MALVAADEGVGVVLEQMRARLDALPPALAKRKVFLSTYRRTTAAVGTAIDEGRFEDPVWVERWDVVFAELYLHAHDGYVDGGSAVPRPWRLAFEAPDDLPDLRHVLLGINAHVNYDLPQALLAVIDETDFGDAALMQRRRADHERIDGVLAGRVAAEDQLLGARPFVDRLLTPLNRAGTRRFLREARRKVWHNTYELHAARVAGPSTYDARLAELEVLSAAKIADLLEPGQVLLRLAVAGFGVTLPPPAR